MEDVKSLEISTSNRKILILDIELCIFQNILEMQLPKKTSYPLSYHKLEVIYVCNLNTEN